MQSVVLRYICSTLRFTRVIAIGFSLTLITTLVMTTPTQAAVVHVNHASTAGSSATGQTWELAFEFLADGLAEAGAGDLVYVATGEYRPDQSLANPTGTGNRALAFALKRGVAVYGGFLPGGTFEERDPEMNPTYLSGDLDGNDDYTATGFLDDPPDYGSMASNSIHVCTALSTTGQEITDTTILDGFIISGGNANGSGYDHGVRGAGLFCGGMNPQTGAPDHFADIKSSPTVVRTKFEFNHAGSSEGTGYAAALYTSYGDPVLRDLCTFADNHSANCAGATVIEHDGVFTALNCTYQDNIASRNGGAHTSRGNSELTIFQSCRFIGNKTTNTEVGNGGALLLVSAASELTNCELRGNTSIKEGGAAKLQNTTVTNCTVFGNSITSATGLRPGTGGIYASTGVVINSSILYGNTSNNGTTLQQQINGPPGSWQCSTTYSDIEGWCSLSVQDCEEGPEVDCTDGVDAETHNLDLPPAFKGTDNLRLTKCSPCIDKGLNSAVPPDDFDLDDDGDTSEETPDADGATRVLDGDADSNDDIDMGAYEYDPDCPADLYVSGAVNGTDLALLLGAWTGQYVPNPCPDEDLSGDCRVNGFDLAILLGAWGECEGVCSQEFGHGGGGGGEEEDGAIAQLVAWYLAGDMAAIIQWLIEQGY